MSLKPGAHILLVFLNTWSFETPRINNHRITAPSALFFRVIKVHSPLKLPKNNHGVTAPSAHILSGYDSLKCQHNNRTHRPGQKLPPPGKWYLLFQIDGKTVHSTQFSKSRALNKFIGLIIEIESFEKTKITY